MRKGISKAERRKALAIGERVVLSGPVSCPSAHLRALPGYLGYGAHNVVCAISRDLVVRVQKEYSGMDDGSWELYTAAQMFPHVTMPTVWELGRLSDGRRYAIAERMACCLGQSDTWREYDIPEVESALLEHLQKHREVSELSDLHTENLMERRRTRELVVTDCYIYD